MNSPVPTSSNRGAGAAAILKIRDAVGRVIVGKDDVIDLALIAMVAGGHVLVEDVPGVGKSTLAKALAAAVGGTFRRVQFTSDLLPADLIGVNVWRASQEAFEFREGPLFANFVLADEVNRAPPRTQSALLEAMGEAQVSVEGHSHALPQPYMVFATQNPQEHYGTYPLPESQRDRFLVHLSVGYADPKLEAKLLQSQHAGDLGQISEAVVTLDTIAAVRHATRSIFVHADLADYAQRIVGKTRSHSALSLGVSTRGALAWIAAARARAFLAQREQITVDDLQELAPHVLAHRVLAHEAGAGHDVAAACVREILANEQVPT